MLKNFYYKDLTLVERVRGWVRCCGFCRNMWGDVDLYCKHCWDQLWLLKKPQLQILPKGQIHFSLFSWQHSVRVKNLIYCLKGGKCHRAFCHIAQQYSYEFNKQVNSSQEDFVFVPAPAKKSSRYDHAFEFAKSLAEVWQGELWCPLQRVEEGNQKQKTKQERLNVSYIFLGTDRPKNLSIKTIVFVDDVFTTGSSARAALLHLEKFSKTMVWTIVRRPLLRKERGNDKRCQ